ncbi:MAG: hypothetical protein JNM65_19550, partial [Verrucomicrobiaceae bacterium]|nr:hypothetical protein [Verrucomicrobiaceae bacterium]
EQLNMMVTKAASRQKAATKPADAGDSSMNVADEARKLLSSQHKTAVTLCQMALNDAEVLHWLREADCEEMLQEVPGTELLAMLARSHFNPLDETSQLVFMSGLERHEEAAFALLQASQRPPGGLEDAKQALYALELARLQNLIQSTQSRLRQPGLPESEMERLQQQVVELTTLRKECLDRAKGSPNSSTP